MDAQEVFERASEKYADCRTYSDVGSIEHGSDSESFKTFFVRPNLFRFEFKKDDSAPGIIWSDGNEYFSTLNKDLDHVPFDRYSSLLLSIKDSAGDASYLVPTLLMPEYAGESTLRNAGPYVFVDHTSIADRSSRRIRSTNESYPFKVDLLIDSLGYKLRKLILEVSSENIYEVLFNEVTFDRDIPDDIFNLKPELII